MCIRPTGWGLSNLSATAFSDKEAKEEAKEEAKRQDYVKRLIGDNLGVTLSPLASLVSWCVTINTGQKGGVGLTSFILSREKRDGRLDMRRYSHPR